MSFKCDHCKKPQIKIKKGDSLVAAKPIRMVLERHQQHTSDDPTKDLFGQIKREGNLCLKCAAHFSSQIVR